MSITDQFHVAFADDNDALVTFPASAVATLGLPRNDADWLISVGLPKSAAPFLSFGNKYEINIPTLKELWSVPESAGGRSFRVIGSNGSGDPVAINIHGQHEIAYLNHDSGFAPVFMNSSVVALAACLLAYKSFVAACREAYGSDAFLDRRAPDSALHEFVDVVESVDPPAIKPTTMWGFEIEEFRRFTGAG